MAARPLWAPRGAPGRGAAAGVRPRAQRPAAQQTGLRGPGSPAGQAAPDTRSARSQGAARTRARGGGGGRPGPAPLTAAASLQLAHVLPTEENFVLLFRCQQLRSCEEFMKVPGPRAQATGGRGVPNARFPRGRP